MGGLEVGKAVGIVEKQGLRDLADGEDGEYVSFAGSLESR